MPGRSGPANGRESTPSTSLGWRAYHQAMFPPGGLVTPWIRFKVMSTGVNVARRLWDQREELREAYEVEHGSDPENWPHRHPGIVIDAVQFVAHAACLGCQWLDQPGTSMSEAGWREASAAVARVTNVRTGSFAVNRTSSSCRWGHPALMRATRGRVTHHRWRSSPWHIQATGG